MNGSISNYTTLGALEQLKAIQTFANNEVKKDEDAVVRIAFDSKNGDTIDRAVKPSVTKDDKVFRFWKFSTWFYSRSDEQKSLNKSTRKLFEGVILRVCGVEDMTKLHPSILKVLNAAEFMTGTNPLSARRIKAIADSVVNHVETTKGDKVRFNADEKKFELVTDKENGHFALKEKLEKTYGCDLSKVNINSIMAYKDISPEVCHLNDLLTKAGMNAKARKEVLTAACKFLSGKDNSIFRELSIGERYKAFLKRLETLKDENGGKAINCDNYRDFFDEIRRVALNLRVKSLAHDILYRYVNNLNDHNFNYRIDQKRVINEDMAIEALRYAIATYTDLNVEETMHDIETDIGDITSDRDDETNGKSVVGLAFTHLRETTERKLTQEEIDAKKLADANEKLTNSPGRQKLRKTY